jgi:hypothetical protein
MNKEQEELVNDDVVEPETVIAEKQEIKVKNKSNKRKHRLLVKQRKIERQIKKYNRLKRQRRF